MSLNDEVQYRISRKAERWITARYEDMEWVNKVEKKLKYDHVWRTDEYVRSIRVDTKTRKEKHQGGLNFSVPKSQLWTTEGSDLFVFVDGLTPGTFTESGWMSRLELEARANRQRVNREPHIEVRVSHLYKTREEAMENLRKITA